LDVQDFPRKNQKPGQGWNSGYYVACLYRPVMGGVMESPESTSACDTILTGSLKSNGKIAAGILSANPMNRHAYIEFENQWKIITAEMRPASMLLEYQLAKSRW